MESIIHFGDGTVRVIGDSTGGRPVEGIIISQDNSSIQRALNNLFERTKSMRYHFYNNYEVLD